MCFIDPVRICEDCSPITIEENKFFDQQIKTLTNGKYNMFIVVSLQSPNSDIIRTPLEFGEVADYRHMFFFVSEMKGTMEKNNKNIK